MDKDKLQEILSQHKLWVMGNGGEKADLRGADLRGAYLRGANLSDANLSDSNLRGADLRGADLRGANLCSACLRGANLSDANLSDSNLRGVDLCSARLRGADLRDADLRDADLRGANLFGTDLFGAYSDNLAKTRVQPLACPEVGAFVGWKKCRNNVIVKLLVPEDAKRSSAYGRKCRCSKAITLAVFGSDEKTAISIYDKDVTYEVGKETLPKKPFDEDRWNECGSGIHFFITREEAEGYST